jgi:hypothetical protein
MRVFWELIHNSDGAALRLAALAPAPPLLDKHETLNFSEPCVWIHVMHPFCCDKRHTDFWGDRNIRCWTSLTTSGATTLGLPLRRLSSTQPVSRNRRTSWYRVFLHGGRIFDICAAIFPHTSRKSYTENTLPAKQFSDPVLNSCGNSPNVSLEQQLQHTTGPCRTTYSSHRHQPTKVLTKGGDLPRAQVDVLGLFRHFLRFNASLGSITNTYSIIVDCAYANVL